MLMFPQWLPLQTAQCITEEKLLELCDFPGNSLLILSTSFVIFHSRYTSSSPTEIKIKMFYFEGKLRVVQMKTWPNVESLPDVQWKLTSIPTGI